MLGAFPSPALVVLAVVSTQLSAAIAKHLFEHIGPLGTVFFRVGFSAILLVAIFRPRVRGHPARDLVLASAFGLSLAFMNLFFYESLASRHLYKSERSYLDSHLVLANASRILDDDGITWGEWGLELICSSRETWRKNLRITTELSVRVRSNWLISS